MGQSEDLGNEILKVRNYLGHVDVFLLRDPPKGIFEKFVAEPLDAKQAAAARELEEKWGAPASTNPRDYLRRARDTLERLSRLDPDIEITMQTGILGDVKARLGSAWASAAAWLYASEARLAFMEKNRELAIRRMEEALALADDEESRKRLEFFRYAPFS
jgi:hypothetical protein